MPHAILLATRCELAIKREPWQPDHWQVALGSNLRSGFESIAHSETPIESSKCREAKAIHPICSGGFDHPAGKPNPRPYASTSGCAKTSTPQLQKKFKFIQINSNSFLFLNEKCMFAFEKIVYFSTEMHSSLRRMIATS